MLASHELEKHKTKHPKCTICDQVYITQADLDSHWFPCQLCATTSRWGYDRWRVDHQRKEHITCSLCEPNTFYKDDKAYQTHKDQSHPKCTNCGIRFNTSARYDQHWIGCPFCPTARGWCNQTQLLNHYHSAHFTCSSCNPERFFDTQYEYVAHKKEHPKCEDCGKRFDTVDLFDQHRHPCDLCPRDQRGRSRSLCDSLLLAHKREKHLKCPLCQAEWFFRDKRELNEHLEHHPQCLDPDCQRRFWTEDELDDHLSRHRRHRRR